MAIVLIPTMSLRYVYKFGPAPELGVNIEIRFKVLQQLHFSETGEAVWVDVPFVKDPQ